MLSLIRFAVLNWRFSLLIGLMITVGGIGSAYLINRESFPPVDFDSVFISAFYPGASPKDVEDQIIIPIENELKTVDGIMDVTSTAFNDQARIVVRIDSDDRYVDVSKVVSDIEKAVDRVQNLPKELPNRPTVTEAKAKEIPVLEIAVDSWDETLRNQVALEMTNYLKNLSGIADVRQTGYRKSEIRVSLNPEKMRFWDISVGEVLRAISGLKIDYPAGYLKTQEGRFLIRLKTQSLDPNALAEQIVRIGDLKRPIRVKDVAEVAWILEPARILTTHEDQPTTLLVIVKKDSVDAIRLANKVKQHISQIGEKWKDQIRISIVTDEARRVAQRLNIVTQNAWQGFAMVLLVSFIFLPWQVGLMIALALPISIFGLFIVMAWQGITFNLVSLLGAIIALGMLVDNAVVVSELYVRKLAENPQNPAQAAIQAAFQFWKALLASVLTTLAAFVPMLVTKGIMGKFIRVIPVVVSVPLLVSLLDAYFLLPARLQWLKFSHDFRQSKKIRWFEPIRKKFEDWIFLSLQHRWITLSIFGALTALILALNHYGNRFELFPKEGTELYVGRLELGPATKVETTQKVLADLGKEIRKLLPNEAIWSIIGRAGIQQVYVADPVFKSSENVGMILIRISPSWLYKLDTNDVLKKLNSITLPVPGSLIFEAIAAGPPVGKALTATFYSPDETQLQGFVNAFIQEISLIPGVFGVQTDQTPTGPEIWFWPLWERVRQANLGIEDLNLAFRSFFQGLIISTFNQEGEERIIRLQVSENFQQLNYLNDFNILQPRNVLVPVAQLVRQEQSSGGTILKRFNFYRSITVTADVDPKIITSYRLNQKAREIFQKYSPQYPQVLLKQGGEEENTQKSIASLKLASYLAILGILAILIMTFNSFRRSIIVLLSVPLSLLGVLLIFWIHQRPLSFLAFIGMVGLAGVIVNGAILLVSSLDEVFSQQPEALKDPLLRKRIIAEITSLRLRPVLITSLTTVVGLMPTAYGWGGYDALLVPMTLALGWGLLLGTLLQLFFVPLVYDGIIRKLGSLNFN